MHVSKHTWIKKIIISLPVIKIQFIFNCENCDHLELAYIINVSKVKSQY